MLSDRDIKNALLASEIGVQPYSSDYLQPSSLDVRLGHEFLVFENHYYEAIDPAEQQELTRKVTLDTLSPSATLMLHPGEFILGCTLESVRLGDSIAARLEGKSSLGRLGLQTHATAGFIDPGFEGQVTLELSNVARLPIKLYPGMKIGQLCFFRLDSPAEKPYGTGANGSRYHGQTGPQASRSYKNFSWGVPS